MRFHGKNFLGSELSALGASMFFGFNPRTGEQLDTPFYEATEAEINRALELAHQAFLVLREASAETVGALLEAIAANIEALGDLLIDQAALESGLGRDRLTGERGRTVNQLRLFAELVRDGSFVDARIDPPLPDRTPLPRPGLRRMLIPVGPVVVFGASNFPLAFSVAGGDTASALAAKNPVIVKGHPAHPGTSELVASAIVRAVQSSGLPAGIFSLVNAVKPALSLALVRHPHTKTVAFTGSQRVGRAIFDAASQRPEPIPAYVEMGSTNPIFVLPGALAERTDSIVQRLTASINLGVGQFCTCPGLVFGLRGDAWTTFSQKMEQAFQQTMPGTMLHPGIARNYEESVARVAAVKGVNTLRSTQVAGAAKTEARPTIFETEIGTWMSNEILSEEVFGPAAILLCGSSEDELLSAAASLPGTLTATIQGNPSDLKTHRKLVAMLEAKCGRILFNDFPTGVEVSHAMHHGGPYPATADAKFTSVGTAAILRFLRPICYQNFPDESVPPELQAANPRKIWRAIGGRLTRDPL